MRNGLVFSPLSERLSRRNSLRIHSSNLGQRSNNWPKTFVYALHDHSGNPRPEDAARELPHGEQEAARRRGESGHATNRFLYP
jgi:hypothetical protein